MALYSTHTKALTFQIQKSQHLDSEPRPAIFPVGVRLIVFKISRCLAWEGLSRVAPVEPAGEYEVGIAEASEDTEHRRQSVRASHLANIQNPLQQCRDHRLRQTFSNVSIQYYAVHILGY